MHIPWDDVQVFLSVVETGSFSKAGRRLGMTQPTISRRVAGLEERLGRPLFRRDVEGAHLTEDGQRLLPAVEQMARWAAEAERVASGFDESPAGVVRIASPPGVAHELLVPFARHLRDRLPAIRVHLIAGIEHLDLSRGHAELAIRSRSPTSPDLTVVAVLRSEIGVFAARGYAEQRPGLQKLAELDWISWAAPQEHLEPTPTLKRLIPDFEPTFASNDFVVQVRAVALGLGVMILPRTSFPEYPYPGLVEIDVGLPLPAQEAYLVCAKSVRTLPRVAATVEALLGYLEHVDGLVVMEP